jgi:hypothetical protein
MKLRTNNKTCVNLNIGSDNKTTDEVQTINFLACKLTLENTYSAHYP